MEPLGTHQIQEQMQADVTNLMAVVAGQASTNKQLLEFSGRAYCYRNNRWVSSSSPNYGTNYFQFIENGGTGANPLHEWENMGTFVPAGTSLDQLHLTGRMNNTQVSDLEILIVERKPTSPALWESGINVDGEMVVAELYRDNWMNPAVGTPFTGATTHRHRRTIPIAHNFTEDAYIDVWVKPVGTITATRYFYMTVGMTLSGVS